MITITSWGQEDNCFAAGFDIEEGAKKHTVVIRSDGVMACRSCGTTTCHHVRTVLRSPEWGKAFLSRDLFASGEEEGSRSITITVPLEVVMDPRGERSYSASVFRKFAGVNFTLTYRERSVAIWMLGIPDLHSALRITVSAGRSVLYYIGSVRYESSLSAIVETVWPWAMAQPHHAKQCVLPMHTGVLPPGLDAIKSDSSYADKFDAFPLLTRGTCVACATSN